MINKDAICSVRFSPDDAFLCSASLEGTIKLWKVSDFTLHTIIPAAHKGKFNVFFCCLTLKVGSIYGTLVINKNRNLLTCSKDRTVKLWNLTNKQPIKVLDFLSSSKQHRK